MFDFIGDVHGCANELWNLLHKLGYIYIDDVELPTYIHPDGHKVVFLGDLVDRGPASDSVLLMARNMVQAGSALCVLGNHDDKLRRCLLGNDVKMNGDVEETLRQIRYNGPHFVSLITEFLNSLPYELVLDDGRIMAVHAATSEHYWDKPLHTHFGGDPISNMDAVMNRREKAKRAAALYGFTTGAKDSDGYPIRIDWAAKYKGDRYVVHGHCANREIYALNNVINIDTACVYGGKLTALRYPSWEIVEAKAFETYVYNPRLSP